MLKEKLLNLKNEALALIRETKDEKELEEIRIRFLGRKGKINQYLKKIVKLPEDERVQVGRVANDVKSAIENSLENQSLKVQRFKSSKLGKEWLDVTAPGKKPQIGHLNPVTQVIWELTEAFEKMGYQIIEGPEITNDWYNFEALNIPKHHPSRDLQDTFWISENLLPRTHTSDMQVRVMEKLTPPFRVAVPGWVYRCEREDATHAFYFTHYEGFAVGKGIAFSDLKGTLYYLVRYVLGEKIKLKFRASYFPYVEPCAEISASCPKCGEKGCPSCGGSGWLEILGAGMIHPLVLKNAKINPKEYSGFAFCPGPTRLAMIKYQIEDIRLFTSADLRFLSQF